MADSVQHPIITTTEKSTQTDKAHRPQTVQASAQTEPPSRNYEEDLKAHVAITEEAKKHHNEAITQLSELREQAAEREVDLKQLLDERTTKLQAMEKEVVDLQAANTEATQRSANKEEMRMQTVL